jgi:hypothetical protein
MRLKGFICCFLLAGFSLSAQELNCNVQINSDKIQGSNKSVFTTLQKAITEFMNTRQWTNLDYEVAERIDCNMNIILNSADGENYKGELVVQSRRPVFNSSYYTNLLNYRDVNFAFSYREFDPLEFNSNNINNSLTAVLAYYAYLVIGFDMDSFSRLGGTPYFQQAENIVSQAQSTDWSGWKAFENDKNRYALISNITDEAFKKFREYFYVYHRLGLDQMSINPTNGRASIAEGMDVVRDAYRSRPNAILIVSFLDTKTDEIINIFKQATQEEKEKVVEILSSVNPSQANRYQQIFQK